MKTYFVTDAHLGSLAFADKYENEKKLVKWMDSIRDDCEALYMLGDMIDFWYEYKLAVPKGFVRFFGKIAEFTDSGIPVYWFTGNHDLWLFDYVQKELGVTVLKDSLETELYGKKLYLAHGDGLGDPSLNFRVLRAIFHNRFCQILFSAINPRIGLAFGLKWAKASRLKREREPEVFKGEDKECLVKFSKEHSAKAGDNAPDYYVFGHRHIILDLQITPKSHLLILGDWFCNFSYGIMDENGFEIRKYES